MENKVLNLNVDDGLLRININDNGLLCFNPSDFSLYNRFLAFVQELPKIEERYIREYGEGETEEEERYIREYGEGETEEIENDAERVKKELGCAAEIDKEVKTRLNAVFGNGADFDKLLGGANCMSYGANGELVISNLLNALKPYLESGVKQHAEKAAERAKLNREQRRAVHGMPEAK